MLIVVGPKYAVGLLERGQRTRADAVLAEVVALGDALRYPRTTWRVPMVRAAFAVFDGRFDEAERLGDEAREIAEKAGSQQAELVWAQQRIAIAMARGEPGRVAPHAERLLAMSGEGAILFPVRAWVLAAIGRSDEARAALENVSDAYPLFGQIFAAEACVLLGDAEAAARVHRSLEEHRLGTLFFWGGLAAGFVVGPTSRLLGDLARLCGRTNEARALYEEAVVLCRRVGSPPFLERSLASLAMLDRKGTTSRPPTSQARGRHVVLEREGDVWAVEGPTHRRFRVKHAKGFLYLSTLLASPGRDIHVLTLIGAEHRAGDGGPVLDARARADYRERLDSLEHEIAEAEAFGDTERARRGREEIEVLALHLSSAVGAIASCLRGHAKLQECRSMNAQPLKYRSIVFGPSGVAEVSGERQVGFVGRDEIQGIAVAYGTVSEAPMREALYALVAIVGAFMCASSNAFAAVGLFAIGGWVFHHALRSRYSLLVSATGYTRRLTFKGRVDRHELGIFLSQAVASFGYPVASTVAGVTVESRARATT